MRSSARGLARAGTRVVLSSGATSGQCRFRGWIDGEKTADPQLNPGGGGSDLVDWKDQKKYSITPKNPFKRAANRHMVMSQADSERMGRVAIVVGGTGMVGKHVCNELANRHATTFSISRRGGVTKEDLEKFPYLKDVQWIKGDVTDPTLWEDLRPILKDLAELHICLPRTGDGADLVVDVVSRLIENKIFLLHCSLLSVPPMWSALSSTARQKFLRAEEFLALHFPQDHLILAPGPILDEYSLVDQVKRSFSKLMHRNLLRDRAEELVNAQGFEMSLTRFVDTKWSSRFIPSVEASHVAWAAMLQKPPDFDGGIHRKIETYGIYVAPFRIMQSKEDAYLRAAHRVSTSLHKLY